MRLIASRPGEFLTDAEVLQEILHVYKARREWPVGRVVFDAFALLMEGRVAAITALDVQTAADLADSLQRLSARDLLHVAVMQRLGLSRFVSADTGFDGISGIERLDPFRFDEWRGSILEGV
jgi:predicted nucleic acid-binding protein